MRRVHVRWAEVDAHALLRAVVAELAGCPSSDVEVRHRCRTCGSGDHGRPSVLVAGRPGPHVSLARAGGRSAVAVADREVGIDLEPAAGRATQQEPGLEQVVLSDRERARLGALTSQQRASAVLEAWVRKEAVLKALGHGLAVDPREVELTGPGRRPRLLAWAGPGRRPAVRLVDLEVGEAVVAAVACVGRRGVRVMARPG